MSGAAILCLALQAGARCGSRRSGRQIAQGYHYLDYESGADASDRGGRAQQI